MEFTSTVSSLLWINATNDTSSDTIKSHKQPYNPWISIMTLAINSILGSLGNGAVVTVYALKNPKNSSELFIFQLACMDLCVSVFYMPLSLYQLITDDRSSFVCLIDKGGAFSYATMSFAMFACIASDRLVAVNKPHDYKMIMSHRRVRLLNCFSFFVGVLSAVPIGKSCFTESFQDDLLHFQLFMKFYSVAVLILVIYLTGAYINVFVVARKTLRGQSNFTTGKSKRKAEISIVLHQVQNAEDNSCTKEKSQPNLRTHELTAKRSNLSCSEHTGNFSGRLSQSLIIADVQSTSSFFMESASHDDGILNGFAASNSIANSKHSTTSSQGKTYRKGKMKKSPKELNDPKELERMKRVTNVKKQRHIALTLFFVTFVFVGCYAPSAVLDLSAWHESIEMPALNPKVAELVYGLLWYSVPANPIIYGFTSPKFRDEARLVVNKLRLCHQCHQII